MLPPIRFNLIRLIQAEWSTISCIFRAERDMFLFQYLRRGLTFPNVEEVEYHGYQLMAGLKYYLSFSSLLRVSLSNLLDLK